MSGIEGSLLPTARPVVLAALLAASMASAWPQARPAVTEVDVARAARNQPTITDRDVARAAKRYRMPTDAELARVPVPRMPDVDALPRPAARGPVDLGAVAKGYEALGGASPVSTLPGSRPSLLVFVSFSMPEATLDRLADQAARAGATLVLRGFAGGSLKETVVRVQRVVAGRKVAVQIDPQAFDRFSVVAVPAVVLVKAGSVPEPCAAGQCFPASSFASVTGDVSLRYAVEYIRRATPGLRADADAFLAKLEGTR